MSELKKRYPCLIYVDTREKPRAILKILAEFEKQGVQVIHQKLDAGDYMLSPEATVTIDRKQSLGEIVSNVTWEKARFQRELRRAAMAGREIIILCEHGGNIKTLTDVIRWNNPRLKTSPKAVSGEQLYKIMISYAAHYGVKWRFCDKRRTGAEILRLLMEHEGAGEP